MSRRYLATCWMVLVGLAANVTIAFGQAAPLEPEHARQMAAGRELFKREVRNVFEGRCLKCHGGEEIEGDFSLATREDLLKGGASGPAIEPRKSTESLLVRLISHADEPVMPEDGAKLDQRQIDAIAQWIDFGAPYDKPLRTTDDADPLAWTRRTIDESDRDFWSFRRLQVVEPPELADDSWGTTTIDRFILAKLREAGITPNEPASRRTLIRRAYFDLIGLPPSAEEVEAFVSDEDPKAYEKVLDRLLASKHHGERVGRHWLDVARFAESHGFEQDYDRPHAYHYRDFVIKAFNADLPFDQFVRWQIAGDEIEPENPLAMMATGFLGAGVFPTQLTEKEFESSRYDELDDMISTTGTAMLGLTIGCARCHDHKFDPIPARDYYQLLSAFRTTIRSNVEIDLDPAGTAAALAKWESEQTPLQEHLAAKPEPALTTVMICSEGVTPIPNHGDGRGFPHFYKDAYFLGRGDVNQKQGIAPEGFLQVLMRVDSPDGGDPSEHWKHSPTEGTQTSMRRRAVADWITDTEHGAGQLLARVIVNRLWQQHLGRGIVGTTNDFGFQGERPTHPELLDWLAGELIRNEWRLKPIRKLIMTSAVYRQDSNHNDSNAKIDPNNLLLWRFSPRRLEAEIIRDSMLAVSGQLDDSQFGPGTLDEAMRRRSIYFMIKRSKLIPFLQVFDTPEPLASVGQRPSTTIAPQALIFMNNPNVREYAKAFALRIAAGESDTLEPSVRRGYLTAIGRQPTDDELAASTSFVEQQMASYQSESPSDARLLALTDLCQVLMSLSEFVYLD